eukprot:TRINITY_DN3134_c0_g2_i11.p1 TRINITY_DN3134_c0_g2~~TRINITY_DN3134_c0_g2_i11.p1  ORF type:complete len:1786 (-),score=221.70 TRINITY_DN3134_c0_g2_i11:93-5450(-)
MHQNVTAAPLSTNDLRNMAAGRRPDIHPPRGDLSPSSLPTPHSNPTTTSFVTNTAHTSTRPPSPSGLRHAVHNDATSLPRPIAKSTNSPVATGSPTMNQLMQRYGKINIPPPPQKPTPHVQRSPTQALIQNRAEKDKQKMEYTMRRRSRSQGNLKTYYDIEVANSSSDHYSLAEPSISTPRPPQEALTSSARPWAGGSSLPPASTGVDVPGRAAAPTNSTGHDRIKMWAGNPATRSEAIGLNHSIASSPPKQAQQIAVPPRPAHLKQPATTAAVTAPAATIEIPAKPKPAAKRAGMVIHSVGSSEALLDDADTDPRKLRKDTYSNRDEKVRALQSIGEGALFNLISPAKDVSQEPKRKSSGSAIKTRWSSRDGAHQATTKISRGSDSPRWQDDTSALLKNRKGKEVVHPEQTVRIRELDHDDFSAESSGGGASSPIRSGRRGLDIPPLPLNETNTSAAGGSPLSDRPKPKKSARRGKGMDTDREAVIKLVLDNRARSNWLYDVFALEADFVLGDSLPLPSPRLKMADLEPFMFCILVDAEYKASTGPVNSSIARAIFNKFLLPVLLDRSTIPGLSRSTAIVIQDALSRGNNETKLPSTLFDVARDEIRAALEQRYHFPTFLEHYLSAFTECASQDVHSEGEAASSSRTTPLQVPEYVFEKFVELVGNEDEQTEIIQNHVEGSKNLSRAHWQEELHYGEDNEDVDVSYCSFADHPDFRCYKGTATVPAPAKKVLDIIMSITDRECWDDLFGFGCVELAISDSAQVRHVDLSVPRYKGRETNSRDLLIFCGTHRMRDGSYVCLTRSVNLPTPTGPPHNGLRAEAYLCGFYIQPHLTDAMSCFVTAVSMLDIKGNLSAEAMRMVNYTQALAPTYITTFLASTEQASRTLGHTTQYPPFMVYAAHNHSVSAQGVDNPKDEHKQISLKGKERDPLNAPISVNPRIMRKQVLSFNEGDTIWVLSMTPHLTLGASSIVGTLTNRLSVSPIGPPTWIGYCNGKYGAFDVDYVRKVPATHPPQVNATASSHSPRDDQTQKLSGEPLTPSPDDETPTTLLDFILDDPALVSVEALIRIEDVSSVGAVTFMNCVRLVYPEKLTPMLVALFHRQGDITSSSRETIFREDDLFCKLLHAFCQTVGRSYLINTLRPLITLVLTYVSEGRSFEIDPARVKDQSTLKNNIINLSEMCTIFLTAITNSRKNHPKIFRRVLSDLQSAVTDKLQEANYLIFVNFFFLRFFCPAIVSPRAYGVLHEDVNISKTARRGLVLISKVIQSLANGAEFGIKEEHMLPLNPWVAENHLILDAFFESLGRKDEYLDKTADTLILARGQPEDQDEELRRLFMLFSDNLHAVTLNFSHVTQRQNLEGSCYPQLLEALSATAPECPAGQELSLPKGFAHSTQLSGTSSQGRNSVFSGIKKATHKIAKAKSSRKLDKIDKAPLSGGSSGELRKSVKEKKKDVRKLEKDKLDMKKPKERSVRQRRELTFTTETTEVPPKPQLQTRSRSKSFDNQTANTITPKAEGAASGSGSSGSGGGAGGNGGHGYGHARTHSGGKSTASVIGGRVPTPNPAVDTSATLPPRSPAGTKARSHIGAAVPRPGFPTQANHNGSSHAAAVVPPLPIPTPPRPSQSPAPSNNSPRAVSSPANNSPRSVKTATTSTNAGALSHHPHSPAPATSHMKPEIPVPPRPRPKMQRHQHQAAAFADIEAEKAQIAAHITSLFMAEKPKAGPGMVTSPYALSMGEAGSRYSLSLERQAELQRLLDYFADRVHAIDLCRQEPSSPSSSSPPPIPHQL